MFSAKFQTLMFASLILAVGMLVLFPLNKRPESATRFPTPHVYNPNGGWCWFQDERAIIDGDLLLFGSVATAPTRDAPRSGDVDLTIHQFLTGETTVVTIHPGFEQNDHAAPALMTRPDGRYLVVYAEHLRDPSFYFQISSEPGDPTAWSGINRMDIAEHGGSGLSYANVYRLADEGRTYNFHRGYKRDPNWMYSDNDGDTWHYGGHLIRSGMRKDRPYPKYASNNKNEIHFILTEGHPRDMINSIYHGFIRDGQLHTSDGTRLGPLHRGLDSSITVEHFTKLFQGDEQHIAWTIDLHLDASNHPYAAFSVTKDRTHDGRGGFDHRYYYARWDGKAWHVHEIAYAGTHLYDPENQYTGLLALNPHNPEELYISTDADPITGAPLISRANGKRHYEIFRGTTADAGVTWRWEPVTHDSTEDNIRPVMVGNTETWALLWMRGTYRTYQDYNTAIVGFTSRDIIPPAK